MPFVCAFLISLSLPFSKATLLALTLSHALNLLHNLKILLGFSHFSLIFTTHFLGLFFEKTTKEKVFLSNLLARNKSIKEII